MVKDNIKIVDDGEACFDKKQIALAIRNSTFNDSLSCSLLDEGVLKCCEVCSLESICDGIDKVVDDYVDSTTSVVDSFSFN